MHSTLLLTWFALAAPLAAQTGHPEVEPNETKLEATVVPCLEPGDWLTGSTNGDSAILPGASSRDTFRIGTCPAELGVYRHDLVFTNSSIQNFGTLVGLQQLNGVVLPGTEYELQNGAFGLTLPPPRNRWYGFGKSEELYLRVVGDATTTAPYVATLSTTRIAPFHVSGTFAPGTITIDGLGQGHMNDTDLWVYDANFVAVPGAGNDEPGPVVLSSPARLVRTLPAGHYTIAISEYNLINDQLAPFDDAAVIDGVCDFPNVLVQSYVSGTVDVSFSISDGTLTQVVSATTLPPYSIAFVSFDVGPSFESFCAGDGFESDHTTPCPCGNNSTKPGFGCAHSADPGGASLSASGSAAADDVVLRTELTPYSAFTLFLQHDAADDRVFHDGVLCAGGNLLRLRGRNASVGAAAFPDSNFAMDATTTLSLAGQVAPGQGVRRYYAALYRNAAATFCPPATANVTNSFRIDW